MRFKTDLEYTLRCSVKTLYPRLSTPEGLAEWFADDVKVKDDIFTFTWHDWETQAKLTAKKENKYTRFEWLDHTTKNPHYFEFTIDVHELTGDLFLTITEEAEHENEEDVEIMWDAHISDLKRFLGI